jgi:electron transport complex protein RnfA
MGELAILFISAVLVNNFVLSYFLGICPFLGVSSKYESAMGMGMAVTFVMTLSAALCWIFYHLILAQFGLLVLQYSVFILVIASLVQAVEMFIRKFSPPLYDALGIYLPLITTNCAILGLALFMIIRQYGFVKSVFFGFSAGVGFLLVLIMMAGIREHLEFSDVPEAFRGAPITLITAGLLALTFMGFAGLVSG